MKKYTKLFATAIALVLLVTMFAGCTKSSETTDESTAANDEATEEVAASDEEVTLTMMHNLSEEGSAKWLDAVIEVYEEEHPNVNIETEVLSSEDYYTLLRSRISADDVPDLFFIVSLAKNAEIIEEGLCVDLSQYEWLEQNMQQSAIDAATTEDGQVPLLSCTTTAMLVTYNKDVFEAAGVEVPTTYSEFLDVCQKIKDAGYAPIIAGYQEPWVIYSDEQCDSIITTIRNDKNNRLDLAAGTTTWTEDKAKFSEVLQRWADRWEYYNDDPFGTDWNTAQSMLATGEGGMIINGSWTMGGVKVINPDANLGTFALPLTENPEETLLPVRASASGFAAYSGSEHVDEAVAFLELLSTPEMGAVMQNTKGEISTSKGVEVAEDSELYEIIEYINKGKTFDFSGYDELFASDELQNATTDCVTEFLMSEEKDVQKCLENLDEAFARIIAN